MNVIVIGLGSMGKRRIRLLRQIDSEINITGVDSRQDRRDEAVRSYGINVSESLDDTLAAGGINCAFVCTSPLSHAIIIDKCLTNGLNVFTEINLVNELYDENIARSRNMNKTLFLSSTPMYRKEVEYIKSKVQSHVGVLSYQYFVGQYLPDWHPWENFNDFFVRDKRTNGCREIMAIEFPWITDVFGRVIDFKVHSTNLTSLNLGYKDTYQILLTHETGHIGMVQIDVSSRVASRYFVCSGESLFIKWGGTPNSVYEYIFGDEKEIIVELYEDTPEHVNKYSSNIIENAYKEELIEFFDVINSKELHGRYSFEQDKSILALIDEIEKQES